MLWTSPPAQLFEAIQPGIQQITNSPESTLPAHSDSALRPTSAPVTTANAKFPTEDLDKTLTCPASPPTEEGGLTRSQRQLVDVLAQTLRDTDSTVSRQSVMRRFMGTIMPLIHAQGITDTTANQDPPPTHDLMTATKTDTQRIDHTYSTTLDDDEHTTHRVNTNHNTFLQQTDSASPTMGTQPMDTSTPTTTDSALPNTEMMVTEDRHVPPDCGGVPITDTRETQEPSPPPMITAQHQRSTDTRNIEPKMRTLSSHDTSQPDMSQQTSPNPTPMRTTTMTRADEPPSSMTNTTAWPDDTHATNTPTRNMVITRDELTKIVLSRPTGKNPRTWLEHSVHTLERLDAYYTTIETATAAEDEREHMIHQIYHRSHILATLTRNFNTQTTGKERLSAKGTAFKNESTLDPLEQLHLQNMLASLPFTEKILWMHYTIRTIHRNTKHYLEQVDKPTTTEQRIPAMIQLNRLAEELIEISRDLDKQSTTNNDTPSTQAHTMHPISTRHDSPPPRRSQAPNTEDTSNSDSDTCKLEPRCQDNPMVTTTNKTNDDRMEHLTRAHNSPRPQLISTPHMSTNDSTKTHATHQNYNASNEQENTLQPQIIQVISKPLRDTNGHGSSSDDEESIPQRQSGDAYDPHQLARTSGSPQLAGHRNPQSPSPPDFTIEDEVRFPATSTGTTSVTTYSQMDTTQPQQTKEPSFPTIAQMEEVIAAQTDRLLHQHRREVQRDMIQGNEAARTEAVDQASKMAIQTATSTTQHLQDEITAMTKNFNTRISEHEKQAQQLQDQQERHFTPADIEDRLSDNARDIRRDLDQRLNDMERNSENLQALQQEQLDTLQQHTTTQGDATRNNNMARNNKQRKQTEELQDIVTGLQTQTEKLEETQTQTTNLLLQLSTTIQEGFAKLNREQANTARAIKTLNDPPERHQKQEAIRTMIRGHTTIKQDQRSPSPQDRAAIRAHT
jgi:hypothetical protein